MLSNSAFGSRHLNRPVLAKQRKYGDDLKACFDMGPLAEQTFDLSRPREVDCLDQIRGMDVLGELVREVVRLREFPERPSRLDGIFLWQTESKARDWPSFRTWPSALYEVEVIEQRASFFADIIGILASRGLDKLLASGLQPERVEELGEGMGHGSAIARLSGTVHYRMREKPATPSAVNRRKSTT